MKRIWAMGNGPSLKKTNLNLLEGEDVIVMNKWGLISDTFGLKWNPKYYFKSDHNPIEMTHVEEIRWAQDHGCKLYLWEMFKDGFPVGHPNHEGMPYGVGDINAVWIPQCRHHSYPANNIKAVKSWHLPEFCTALGGMNTVLQIAVMEGYEEIYLLGCDANYTPFADQNYAVPNYYTKDLTDKSAQNNMNTLALHHVAKRSSPIPIYNATIGGNLEVYERVEYEKCF